MAERIEQDSVALVHYTGTFVDGEVFDSSEGKGPLAYLVGHGQMIQGFEQEMLGATIGETREFTLTPDRAYGERDEDAVQKIDRNQFPEEMQIEVGMIVGAQSDQGPIQFSIKEIDEAKNKMEIEAHNHKAFSMNIEQNQDSLQRHVSQLEQDKLFMNQQVNDLKLETSALGQQLALEKQKYADLESLVSNERRQNHEGHLANTDLGR